MKFVRAQGPRGIQLLRTLGSAAMVALVLSCIQPECPYTRDDIVRLDDWTQFEQAGSINPPIRRFSNGTDRITLVGTFHTLPAQFPDLGLIMPAAILDEISRADMLLVESNLVTLRSVETLIYSTHISMQLEQSDSRAGRAGLEDFLHARSPELPQEFAESLSRALPTIEPRRVEQILALRPWAARDRMKTVTFIHAGDPVDWRDGVDLFLVREARRRGTEVGYLETWQELADRLDRANQERYVEELLFAVIGSEDHDCLAMARIHHTLELLRRWTRDDLEETEGFEDTVYRLMGVPVPENVREGWKAEELLLYDEREELWVRRILDRLDSPDRTGAPRSVVVAVGASHVSGGLTRLPALLRDAGFEPMTDALPLEDEVSR